MEREAAWVATAQRVFGGAIALVGVMHVIFGEAAARLFPVWPEALPGRPWWAYAAGAALAVLGAMIVARTRAREAAAGIGLIVLLSVLGQHLPRAIPSGALGNAWLSVLKFGALAAGAAFVAHGMSGGARRPALDRAIAFGAAATPWLMGAFMIYSGYLHLRYTASVTRLLPPWMPWPMFWVSFTGATLLPARAHSTHAGRPVGQHRMAGARRVDGLLHDRAAAGRCPVPANRQKRLDIIMNVLMMKICRSAPPTPSCR